MSLLWALSGVHRDHHNSITMQLRPGAGPRRNKSSDSTPPPPSDEAACSWAIHQGVETETGVTYFVADDERAR